MILVYAFKGLILAFENAIFFPIDMNKLANLSTGLASIYQTAIRLTKITSNRLANIEFLLDIFNQDQVLVFL